MIVLHDELDLAPGKVKFKMGGGHAGHNGLRSIHSHLGPEYGRVRLGIGHPGHKDRVAGYVLNDFAKAEADWLDDVYARDQRWRALSRRGRQCQIHERREHAHGTSRAPRQAQRAQPKPQLPKPQPEPQPNDADAQPMQKLMERFK